MNIKKYKLKYFLTLPIFISLLLLIWGSIKWVSFTGSLNIKNISLIGNNLISEKEYKYLINNFLGSPIFSIDLRNISSILEKHSYVQGAKVSRVYPNGLYVQLTERKPIAVVNLTPPLLLDENGMLFPLRGDFSDYEIPVLSHLVPKSNSFIKLNNAPLKSMTSANYILNLLFENYPDLYKNISELRLNNQEDFEIILLDRPTKVILGKDQFSKKLSVLIKFNEQLIMHKKNITDFKKLDLRFERQVVVRGWV